MIPIYPLRFHPIYKEKIWGSRLHAERLKAPVPVDAKIGESWEIVDQPEANSVVANGVLAGTTLRELMLQAAREIIGPEAQPEQSFPLLIKFIGTGQACSLQVHPPDDYVRKHHPEKNGKTEMWYILEHKPQAELLIGLKKKMSPGEVREAIKTNRMGDVVNHVRVLDQDAFFLPAGRIHSIGAGILLAEIQQNSDMTFRLFDYGRNDPGHSRDLHIEQALEVINYQDVSNGRLPVESRLEQGVKIRSLVRHPYFNGESRTFFSGMPGIEHDGFQILIGLSGSGWIVHELGREPMAVGSVFLLPASLENWRLESEHRTEMSLLRVWKGNA